MTSFDSFNPFVTCHLLIPLNIYFLIITFYVWHPSVIYFSTDVLFLINSFTFRFLYFFWEENFPKFTNVIKRKETGNHLYIQIYNIKLTSYSWSKGKDNSVFYIKNIFNQMLMCLTFKQLHTFVYTKCCTRTTRLESL